MLFNSLDFLLFLPLAIGLFYFAPHKGRWLILLLLSYFFYMMWKPEFIILILISTVVDYTLSIYITRKEAKRTKRILLWVSIIVNLGILIIFKYNNFFIENVNMLITQMGGRSQIPLLQLVLPMGISFYTFQTMSYTIDVYRGNIKPERHFGYFALYVCYFPQLVAGPIERAGDLLNQFKKKSIITYQNFSWGGKQIIWGLFKKVVIADRLSVIIDQVYENPGQHDGLSLIFASYLFAIQIYCDFSGYSDIAIGVSRMFGIKLKMNFNLPYSSLSFQQFWSKWHISLSGWFRDYLYIPLGGNRVARPRWLLNLFIVFVVSGFWHGSKWTFIIWGALHGVYLIVEQLLGTHDVKLSSKWSKIIRRIVVFNLVVFAWIFFRANSTSDSFLIVSKLFDWDLSIFSSLIQSIGNLQFLFLMTLLVMFLLVEKLFEKIVKENYRFKHGINHLLFAFITVLILIFGFFGEAQFIYFQF
jgi:alginate O-acetyltransferase complex protein AlgI